MSNPKWCVNAVEVHDDYILRIWFEDGSVKDFNCREIFTDKPFEPLQDRCFFSQAHVFADTVAWNDEIDIAPEYLYEHGKPCGINWDEFTSQDTEDIRDGLSPEDYVRSLRDDER